MTTSPVPSITEDLLQELEQKAKGMHGWPNDSAFSGDGHWCVGLLDEDDNEYPVVEVHPEWYDQEHHGEQMARYYAAANPATILALIATIRAQAAELDYMQRNFVGSSFNWDDNGMCVLAIKISDRVPVTRNFADVITAAIAQEGADHE